MTVLSDEERHVQSHLCHWAAYLGFAYYCHKRGERDHHPSIEQCRKRIWQAVPQSDRGMCIAALKQGWPLIPDEVAAECVLPIQLLEELEVASLLAKCRWIPIYAICSTDIEREAMRSLAPTFARRHPTLKPERYIPITADEGERICVVCGCSDLVACVDENGNPCSWVTDDLCSCCGPIRRSKR